MVPCVVLSWFGYLVCVPPSCMTGVASMVCLISGYFLYFAGMVFWLSFCVLIRGKVGCPPLVGLVFWVSFLYYVGVMAG